MTITRSSVTTNQAVDASSNSFSYTVPSGTTLVVVRSMSRSTVGGGQGITNVTLGGGQGTIVSDASSSTGLLKGTVHYFSNPVAGSNTITATWFSNVNSIIAVTSFTGGIAVIKSGANGTGTTSVSVTLPTALLSNEYALDIMGSGNTRTWTMGTNQTKEWGQTETGPGTAVPLYSNGSYSNTVGKTTMSWTPNTTVIAVIASVVIVREFSGNMLLAF